MTEGNGKAKVRNTIARKAVFNDNGTLDHIEITPKGGESRTFRIASKMLHQFAAYGAERKLTVAAKEGPDALDKLIKDLNAGNFRRNRGGNGITGLNALGRAIMQYKGKTAEETRDFLKGLSLKDKINLRQSAELKHLVDDIEAKRPKKVRAQAAAEALLADL